jgi:acylphosphatase
MRQTISIKVSGRVQGVFFRQSAKEQALGLRINGTVKNLPDGAVRLIATGTAGQLALLIKWCKKGPSGAQVTNIIVEDCSFQEFSGFKIER